MVSFWQKLNYLVPEPVCRTKGNKIIEWKDSRPQPLSSDIDGVTEQEVIDKELDKEAGNVLDVDKKDRLLREIIFGLMNRINSLENKNPINRQQYKDIIISLYKGL